eukprot:scaffold47463_cov18-Tisochrysis_lutea.AAC.1
MDLSTVDLPVCAGSNAAVQRCMCNRSQLSHIGLCQTGASRIRQHARGRGSGPAAAQACASVAAAALVAAACYCLVGWLGRNSWEVLRRQELRQAPAMGALNLQEGKQQMPEEKSKQYKTQGSVSIKQPHTHGWHDACEYSQRGTHCCALHTHGLSECGSCFRCCLEKQRGDFCVDRLTSAWTDKASMTTAMCEAMTRADSCGLSLTHRLFNSSLACMHDSGKQAMENTS